MSNHEEFESELFQNMEMEDKENLSQSNKYDMALGKYNTALKDDEIAAKPNIFLINTRQRTTHLM